MDIVAESDQSSRQCSIVRYGLRVPDNYAQTGQPLA